MTKNKEIDSEELIKKGAVHIKDELKPSHLEEIIKVIEAEGHILPILLIEDLKNGKDFELIKNIHDYLEMNFKDVGCIISGENHFSTMLLLSSEHIKYRTATSDTQFVFDLDDYKNKNSEKNNDGLFFKLINDLMKLGNPFNVDSIMEMFEEGEVFCVHDAYVLSVIDMIMPMSKDELKLQLDEHNIISIIRSNTKLYMRRMVNIKEHFFKGTMNLH